MTVRDLDDRDHALVSSDHSECNVANVAPHVHAPRDRILRAAFLIDLYGVRIRGFDLLAMRERLEVDSTFARVC